MDNISKTMIHTSNEMGADYDLRLTLNSEYNVGPSIMPNNRTSIKYVGIGIEGFQNNDSDQGSMTYNTSPLNGNLYTQIPIRMVPVSEDLDDVTRNQYRMRVKKTINNIDYWAYYLKKLIIDNEGVEIVNKDIVSGNETILTELDSSIMTPTPSQTSAIGSVSYANEMYVRQKYNIIIDSDEITEVCSILFNDTSKAKISEIGLYTGEDQTFTDEYGTNYTESICAQLAYHQCLVGIDMTSNSIDTTFVLKSSTVYLV